MQIQGPGIKIKRGKLILHPGEFRHSIEAIDVCDDNKDWNSHQIL